MLAQFAVVLLPLLVSVAAHAVVLAALTRRQLQVVTATAGTITFRRMVRMLFFAFLAMMASHSAQTVLWALLYRAVGAFGDFEAALYFSITCYSTLGFGDLLAPLEWRLLGPLEAVTGILMFGWSTGYLFAFFSRLHVIVEGGAGRARG